jgi:hypothetical protein
VTGPDPAPPVTLASLTWDWGGAYDLGYDRDWWTATRRDGHAVLFAHTLAALETAIMINYRTRPVPRDFDPPGAADYLQPPGQDDEAAEEDAGLDDGTLVTVRELRSAFPLWTITYSAELDAWIGQTRKKTICQNSAVSLALALTLIERRERA